MLLTGCVLALVFRKKFFFEDEKGGIAHAQLTYGNAMIMLGTVMGNEYDKYIKLPDEISGFNTLSLYIVVKDIEAHYQKVKNNGVKICVPLTWQDYGGGDYTCKDLEGYLWSFGSYDPWAKT